MDSNKVIKALLGGNIHENENKILHEEIAKLKSQIQEQKKDIEKLTEINKKEQQNISSNSLMDYTFKNMKQFIVSKTGEELLQNPDIFKYDETLTAFDKNITKFYKYQKEFIEDWSVSAQELVILYYGVGTGKTMIAVNCAEQYISLNPTHYVYFLTPASLVLNVIAEMYRVGIDAGRKHENGDYIYNFVSYQQLLRSDFNFKPNSLLIVDEVHNLRNFYSKEIKVKISARKWASADQTYSLVGTKLGIRLLEAQNKFVRSIFMTGTLFVNDETDIEPIISLGYKKQPLTRMRMSELMLINNDIERMKRYYNGLISFYRKPTDTPNFPMVKYDFVPIVVKTNEKFAKDPFFVNTRNIDNYGKAEWVANFCRTHIEEKTLIYAQFLDRTVYEIADYLDTLSIKYGIISGKLDSKEKANIVKEYNDNKIKVLIFTLAIKEGISFTETNNFIFTQPYWNYAITEQVIARAIRASSHSKGNKSLVNVYMLYSIDKTMPKELSNNFKEFADKIMNNDIKTYIHEITKEEKDESGKVHITTKIDNYHETMDRYSRDIDLYLRMFDKQAKINKFENNLLYKVPRFEDMNNIESNEFIEEYNTTILDIEQNELKKGEILSNKEKIKIKQDMYNKYFTKELKKVNARIVRLHKDPKFKINRNPDLETQASLKKYENQIPNIKKMLDNNYSLSDILESYKISKEEITSFQANFTPESEVEIALDFSGLGNDKRDKIMILEPTSGIGNFINSALKLSNKQNLFIDGVEIHNLFYQIAMAQFSDIDNVMLYNCSIFDYDQKYNYDYIIGNPPFNIRTQIDIYDKKTNKIIKQDRHFADIDFVSLCYNKLNKDGILCMIISDKFTRDQSIKYEIFNKWLDALKKINSNNVQIKNIGQFKKDLRITKSMETNYPMVCLKLVKVDKFEIDLLKSPPVLTKDELDENKKLIAKEKRKIKSISKAKSKT